MRLQYCQLLCSTHFNHKLRCFKAQDCFPLSAFDLIRERYVVATTSEATSWLDCVSCEGFSTSRNAVFISQQHAARTEVTYNLLDGMNRLAMGTFLSMVLQPFSSFAEHGLHSPSTTMGSVDSQETGSRLVGRRRMLQKPSTGVRGQRWVANPT